MEQEDMKSLIYGAEKIGSVGRQNMIKGHFQKVLEIIAYLESLPTMAEGKIDDEQMAELKAVINTSLGFIVSDVPFVPDGVTERIAYARAMIG